MSTYTKMLQARIERVEQVWDLTEPESRRELRGMKRRLWWYSGPSTVFAVVVGQVIGYGIVFGAISLYHLIS